MGYHNLHNLLLASIRIVDSCCWYVVLIVAVVAIVAVSVAVVVVVVVVAIMVSKSFVFVVQLGKAWTFGHCLLVLTSLWLRSFPRGLSCTY